MRFHKNHVPKIIEKLKINEYFRMKDPSGNDIWLKRTR